MLLGGAVAAQAPTLEGERLAGAFVTMTPGARCPSASTIAFSAQGEADGEIAGRFDARGTLDLAPGETGGALRGLAASLDFNQQRGLGTIGWDSQDPPLRLTCDPLSLRIEGRVRYSLTAPFADTGWADLAASGSR